jgi:hypothetical protein
MVPARSTVLREIRRGAARRRGRAGDSAWVGLFAALGLLVGAGLAVLSRNRVTLPAFPGNLASGEVRPKGEARSPGPARPAPSWPPPSAQVEVQVRSDPPGAVVRPLASPPGLPASLPFGESRTPAVLSLPRSSRPVVLRLSLPGCLDEQLQVVPDAPRSYFVRLRRDLVDRGGPLDSNDTVAREIDLFIDRYLDIRMQGCCRRHGHGRCGQVLLEVALSPSGKVQTLQSHLTPPAPELEECFAAILSSATDQRFTPFSGPSRSFVRSYHFDEHR